MPLLDSQKIGYFTWALGRSLSAQDHGCPGCGSSRTSILRRKYLVTSLRECGACGLRFRTPKDDPAEAEEFYQERYSQGITTDCPSDESLASLIAHRFQGSEKDFRTYMSVIRAAGLSEGDSILDFGASWGYGSWQLSRAGFNVFSLEISAPRAEYAKTKLACNMIASVEELAQPVQCMFSAHVIEHLPDPELIWKVADRVLTDDGVIVCFCPNGEPAREELVGSRQYHHMWGKVHPVLITPGFLRSVSTRHGWTAAIYSNPYQPGRIINGQTEDIPTGDELCMIARRNR
jgi:Methyltransferase domain